MILALDFGPRYTQMIARRVREVHVYCEIHPFSLSLDRSEAIGPGVRSGGGEGR